MKQLSLLVAALLATVFMPLQSSFAETVVDGEWISTGDANGAAKCTLTITSQERHPEYGDEYFTLESSGDGSCEWSAMGLSKSYAISAGLVTSAGVAAFVRVTFPFGPAGSQLVIDSLNLDGSVRNSESFTRLSHEVSE